MDDVMMEPDALAALGRHLSGVADGEVRDGAGAAVTATRAIATALPGTPSAGLAEELARRWERLGAAWASALRAHGAALTAAATGQQDAEHDATRLLRTAGPNGAGPYPGGAGGLGDAVGPGGGDGAP